MPRASESRTPATPAFPAVPDTRRRGTALTTAIYLAALSELAETSFEELSFDKIAARAGAGKASLYRRWSTTAELVLEALSEPALGMDDPVMPATGSLRTDLIALLTNFARALDQPAGRALRPLMTQRPRHPELYAEVHRRITAPRREALLAVLRAGADRGEVAPEAVTERIAEVGPQLVIAAHMDVGTISRAEIEAIVTQVLLPLTAPRLPHP